MAESSEIRKMEDALKKAETSFHVLFEKMNGDGSARVVCDCNYKDLLEALRILFRKLHGEVSALGAATINPSLESVSSEEPDSVDAWNEIAFRCNSKTFRQCVDDALFDALMRINHAIRFSPEMLKAVEDPDTVIGSSMRHAVNFAKALERLLSLYLMLIHSEGVPELSRLNPEVKRFQLSSSLFLRSTLKGLAMELDSRFVKHDVFSSGHTFRYAHGEFTSVLLKSIRGVNEFYGYGEAKRVFSDHFGAFASGRYNLPLLVSGLPGLGKTQMTIAYCLKFSELTLILAGPEDLQEGLEGLIAKLTPCKNKKFVLFFDDIDTRSINWYYFRTYIGGSFSLPPNMMVVLASNYGFPPNISSRGRVFNFPLFDEIRCQEMIEDLFLSRGMKHITPDLLSVIAADYVEAFGQKEFDELSPRTLARYLELYLDDSAKRRRMLELSRGEVITRPDSQVFYEMNMKLLRALYGEEAIDEVRKKELDIR